MIKILEGTVDAAADLEAEVTLTEQEKDALAAAILDGAALLRVYAGAATGSPTATLNSIEVSFDASGDAWRKAQDTALEAAMETDETEYEGPLLTSKLLAMRPARLRLIWTDETLGAENYFEDCVIGILLSNRR